MEDEQSAKTAILRDVNAILTKNVFAHHPNCGEYDHHVITLGNWRFCLGCTAIYSGILFTFFLDFLILSIFFSIDYILRFTLGILFFVATFFQLQLKSELRLIRFLLRFSLGVSIYYLISFLYYLPFWWLQVPGIIVFLITVRYYSSYQGSRKLRECTSCSYGEEYHTCLIKYRDLLEIENLHLVKDSVPEVADLIQLRMMRESGETERVDHTYEIDKSS